MSPGAIYDLNFFMVERDEGWRASCEYNTDLYDAATARRLLAGFRSVLEGIADGPDRRLSEIPSRGIESRPRPPITRTRRATAEPVAEAPAAPEAPRDETEARLAAIWRSCWVSR